MKPSESFGALHRESCLKNPLKSTYLKPIHPPDSPHRSHFRWSQPRAKISLGARGIRDCKQHQNPMSPASPNVAKERPARASRSPVDDPFLKRLKDWINPKTVETCSIFWHLLHVNLSKLCEGQLKTISPLPAFSISPGRSQHRHGHLHLQPRKFLWYVKISTPISPQRTKQGGVNNGLCWTQTWSQAFIVKSFNKKHHEIFYWSSTFLGSAPFGGVQILVHGLAESCLCHWNQKQDFLFF